MIRWKGRGAPPVAEGASNVFTRSADLGKAGGDQGGPDWHPWGPLPWSTADQTHSGQSTHTTPPGSFRNLLMKVSTESCSLFPVYNFMASRRHSGASGGQPSELQAPSEAAWAAGGGAPPRGRSVTRRPSSPPHPKPHVCEKRCSVVGHRGFSELPQRSRTTDRIRELLHARGR